MIAMFPAATPIATVPCRKCRTPVRVTNLVAGAYGEDCAGQLGLIVRKPKLRAAPQSGADLFDYAHEEDLCDGWDR